VKGKARINTVLTYTWGGPVSLSFYVPPGGQIIGSIVREFKVIASFVKFTFNCSRCNN